jgi:hypothetical protein
MICAPGLVFDGRESDGSRFNILCANTSFWRYRGFCVLMFCTPLHVFDSKEGVRSCFDVLRSRNHFSRYRGRRVPFSCLALPDSFLAVPRASGPTFLFCTLGLVFGGTEGVRSRFHVLRSPTRFSWYREHRVTFSCFDLPDTFSAVRRVPGPVIMFYATALIFGETVSIGSRFHVLRP